MRNLRKRQLPAMALAAGLSYAATFAQASDWEWLVVPYLWAADTTATVDVDPYLDVEGGIEFEDVVDKLEYGGQLHIEGMRDHLGLFLDLTYLAAGDNDRVSGSRILPDGTRVEADIEETLAEFGGVYRLHGEPGFHGFDIIAGVRVIETEVELDVDFPGPAGLSPDVDASDTLVDGFVGARYGAGIGQRWNVALRGDVASGDTDFSWNLQANLIYTIGDTGRHAIVFAYRHLELDLESSDGGRDVDTELTMSGPALGFVSRF